MVAGTIVCLVIIATFFSKDFLVWMAARQIATADTAEDERRAFAGATLPIPWFTPYSVQFLDEQGVELPRGGTYSQNADRAVFVKITWVDNGRTVTRRILDKNNLIMLLGE